MSERSTFTPKPAVLTGDDLDGMRFDYDGPSDTLLVHLGGVPRPAITVVADDYVSYRVDLETEEIVGYQIEDFLAEAVAAVPGFLTIADTVGIEPERLARARRAVTPGQRRRAAAEALIGHVVPLGSP